jgi:hypothetical protein
MRIPNHIFPALGITDPFGAQLQLYQNAYRVISREYMSRLSYHKIEPDWIAVEKVCKQAKATATSSLLGLLTFKLRTLALNTIEKRPKVGPARGLTTGQAVAEEIHERLCRLHE